jgi:hypothetical protein
MTDQGKAGLITLFNKHYYTLLKTISSFFIKGRPIELLIFRENIIFINLHAPHDFGNDYTEIKKIIKPSDNSLNDKFKLIKTKIKEMLREAKKFIEDELLIFYKSKFIKSEEAKSLSKFLKFDNYRIIIAGDFNSEIHSSILKLNEFNLNFYNQTPIGTCCYKKKGDDEYGGKFDHILDSYNKDFKFFTIPFKIQDKYKSDKKNYMSDHLPVFGILAKREFNFTKLNDSLKNIQKIEKIFCKIFNDICIFGSRGYPYFEITGGKVINKKFNFTFSKIKTYEEIDTIINQLYIDYKTNHYILSILDSYNFYKTLTLLEITFIDSYMNILTSLSDIVQIYNPDRTLFFHFSDIVVFGTEGLDISKMALPFHVYINIPYVVEIINNIFRKAPKLRNSIIVKRNMNISNSKPNLIKFLLNYNGKSKWIVPSVQSSTIDNNVTMGGSTVFYIKLSRGANVLDLTCINKIESELLFGSGYRFNFVSKIENSDNILYIECDNCNTTDIRYMRTYEEKNYKNPNLVAPSIDNDYNLITNDQAMFKKLYIEKSNKINDYKLASNNLWFYKYQKYKNKYGNIIN